MEVVNSSNSVSSKIVKKLVSFSNYKSHTESIENAKSFINMKAEKQVNLGVFKKMTRLSCEGDDYYFYDNKCSNGVLLYIHGGSFVDKPLNMQISYAKKVATSLGLDLVIPLYQTLPVGKCLTLLNQCEKLYLKMVEKYKCVYLLGDSAGGGAALALNMKLIKDGYQKPRGTILLSPWLDVSLSNPRIKAKIDGDIVCAVNGNKYFGKVWADKLSVRDYRVSPVYGDVSGLDNIFISSGGNEICQPDCIKLVNALKKKNINYKYIEFENQFHNFELYPIREANLLLNEIVDYYMESCVK